MHKNSAFTLIELSIALVIIGLVVGGVVVGKDMIRNAQLQRQVTQIEQLKTAINVFKGKYNCLPGDCARAEQFSLGFSANPGANGDGNETIRSYGWEFGGNWANQREKLNFWYHLSEAEMITEILKGYDTTSDPGSYARYHPIPIASTGTETPGTAGIVPFSATGYGNGLALVNIANSGGYEGALNVQGAYWLDSKMDDGLPATGKIRMISPYSGIAVHDTTTLAYGCNVNGTNRYDLAGQWVQAGGPGDTGNKDRIECGLAWTNLY